MFASLGFGDGHNGTMGRCLSHWMKLAKCNVACFVFGLPSSEDQRMGCTADNSWSWSKSSSNPSTA